MYNHGWGQWKTEVYNYHFIVFICYYIFSMPIVISSKLTISFTCVFHILSFKNLHRITISPLYVTEFRLPMTSPIVVYLVITDNFCYFDFFHYIILSGLLFLLCSLHHLDVITLLSIHTHLILHVLLSSYLFTNGSIHFKHMVKNLSNFSLLGFWII